MSGTTRVWILSGVLAAVSTLVAISPLVPAEALDAPLHVPLVFVIFTFTIAELCVAHFQFRSEAYSCSLSEIPMIAGLFFCSPMELIAARVIGSALALTFRHQRGIKLVFNLSHFGLTTVLALAVFYAFVDRADPLGPSGWAGSFLAAAVSDFVASLAVGAAISLSESRVATSMLVRMLAIGSIASFTNAGLGLMTTVIMWHEPRVSWLLVLAAVALFLGYRGYGRVRKRQESLEVLYELSRLGQRQADVETVMNSLLSYGREMFHAERAEIVLLGSDGSGATRTTAIGSDAILVEQFALEPGEPLWGSALGRGKAGRFTRDEDGEALDRYGLRDAMVAPLYADNAIVGAMMIADRLGQVDCFTEEDLKLFETLANHVSVSVDNAQLIQRLRVQAEENQHMALHDGLTGLANRTLFRTRVRQAIHATETEPAWVSVLLLDLDRFKEINDTLGHHMGDVLLKEVAKRLAGIVGEDGIVARLGGDEFAILLPGPRPAAALDYARTLSAGLEEPFPIGDLALDVGASIGVAVYPEHGEDPDTLIQRADVAMYLAKDSGAPAEIYDHERDLNSEARLTLLGDLKRSIERDELVLHYQPKVDVRTGVVTGAEALVRWEHPERGLVYPDHFISQAEHTGQIKPLTMWVLERAIRDVRAWRKRGMDITVAVNLSTRVLRDAALPGEVEQMLKQWNVPASALVLEVTEGSIMADPECAIAILTRLNAMGIGLSVDDFGTGYSSLSQLRSLPVHEIKMDKSFVMGMLAHDGDGVIVRSTIDLGRNLGLRVVAEGVESADILAALGELGCDIAQGYYLSKPVPEERFLEWMKESGGRVGLRAEPVASLATIPPLRRTAMSASF